MTPSLLVVGDAELGQQLSAGLGDGTVACKSDPYEALEEMSRQRWAGVLLQNNQSDFAGLCRASRRLQPASQLLGACGVSDEPSVRSLVGSVLDDYFIYPPSEDDIRRLRKIGGQPAGSIAAPAGAVSTELMSELMLSARNVRSLEDRVCAVVSALAGAPASWVDSSKLSSDSRPLLKGLEGRVLVCSIASEPAAEFASALSAMSSCLPALLDNAVRMESLHRLAITDHLTGAFNRRYFYHLTDQVLAHAKPEARAALLLYDIDNFKQYNDTFGYAVGDQIIRQAVTLMKSVCRSSDMVARIGGDEFCVLFWEPQGPREAGSLMLQTAYDLGERFRAALANEKFTLLGPRAVGKLTISGGLALFPRDGRNVRDLLRSADKALKSAKKAGKDGIAIVGQ